MIANVHIFNVNHGDSIVIELIHEEITRWIVIDSNRVRRNNTDVVPALAFLQSKGVTQIDTVILTHFHGDHYSGLEQILNSFAINRLIIPPVFSEKTTTFNNQIAKIKGKVSDLINRSSDDELGKRAYSLAFILKFIVENEDKIYAAEGPETVLRIQGISEPIGKIYLPLKRIKGQLRQIIEKGDFEIDSFKNMNDASVVMSLEFGSHKLLFGADSTYVQWHEHKRLMARSGVSGLHLNGIKVLHHGSDHNNNEDLYSYLLTTENDKRAYVSANGKSHPDDVFFELVNKFNLKPYCTNLAKQCMGQNVVSISGISKIPREFRSFISGYDIEDLPVGCQGDITIHLDGTTETVYTSLGNACPFRFGETINTRKLI